MTITLELTESSGTAAGIASQHVFGEGGGTIGRANSNGWVLAHNKVSGKHALITFRNGVFYIEDTSLTGVCVNSPDNRLVRNRPTHWKTGDRLFIEPYEIAIWIEGDSGAPRPRLAAVRTGRPVPGALVPRGPLPAPGDLILPIHMSAAMWTRSSFSIRWAVLPARVRELPVDDGLGQHYQPPAIVSPPAPPSPAPPASGGAGDSRGLQPLADDPFVESIVPDANSGSACASASWRFGHRAPKPREGSGSPETVGLGNHPIARTARGLERHPSGAAPRRSRSRGNAGYPAPDFASAISGAPAAEPIGRAPAADAAPAGPPVHDRHWPACGEPARGSTGPTRCHVNGVRGHSHKPAQVPPGDNPWLRFARPSDLAALLAGAACLTPWSPRS